MAGLCDGLSILTRCFHPDLAEIGCRMGRRTILALMCILDDIASVEAIDSGAGIDDERIVGCDENGGPRGSNVPEGINDVRPSDFIKCCGWLICNEQ